MWQSAQARPLPPGLSSVRSWKLALLRQNALSPAVMATPVRQPSASSATGFAALGPRLTART